MSINPKQKILLIGYDSNIGLGVLFCLRSFNYECYLLSHNLKNAAQYSRYIKKSFFYNDDKDDVAEKAAAIAQTYHIDLIMPYDELETRKITEKKAFLSQYAHCIMGTNPELFNIGIHKLHLAEFLTKHNVPCPAFATYNNKAQLNTLINESGFPLLLKPVRQSAGRMIQKIYDMESLHAFFASGDKAQDAFIIQPFIIGTDVTCNVICKDGEIICYTIQESPVKTGSNFSTNDTLEYHEDADVIRIVGKMMQLLQWNGVACVDMRRDVKNQSVNILEINGRFWASVVPSYMKAGVNFPLILAKLSMGEPVQIPTQKPAKQISLKQYLVDKIKFKKVSIKETKYESYFADPFARIMQQVSK